MEDSPIKVNAVKPILFHDGEQRLRKLTLTLCGLELAFRANKLLEGVRGGLAKLNHHGSTN